MVGSHQRHGLARVLEGSVAETPRPPRDACARRLCAGGASAPVGALVVRTLPRIRTVLAADGSLRRRQRGHPARLCVAARDGGVVELCFVAEHGLPNPPYVYDHPDRLTAAERAQIGKQLRALVPADAAALGITTHVSVIDGGKPAETIVAAAERLNVDAISLASHGRSGVARAVIGSVAEAVVRGARRPVLVVPARRRAS